MRGFYRRFLQVAVRLLPFAVAFARDQRRFLLFGSARQVPEGVHEERAEHLVETLLQLGAAFIKAGQVLSTRPDIVPPIYAEALSTLQDEVPEDSGQDPAVVVEEELGDAVDPGSLTPIAGGSLAYVYTADIEGEEVALKVRRPGLKPRIARDLRIIRKLVPFVGLIAEERQEYSIRNIADDFERIIFDELDFEREARMMRLIGENFADDERVYIPDVDEERTTERVLVMEYAEGERVTDTEALREAGVDPEEMAERIADIYLSMGLEHGVFHADPHPGNLSVMDDGTLLIYDYGMSEQLTPETQQRIIDLYRSLARRDTDGLIDALIALDVLAPEADRGEVRRVLELAMENLEGRSNIDWRDIITELFTMLHDFPFRIPPNVMLLLRVGTVTEGVCRQLDPEFDFVAFIRSFLVEHGLFREELQKLATEVRNDLRASAPVLARLPARTDRLFDRLERGELRIKTERPDPSPWYALSYAILAGALVVASALLTFHERPYELVGLIGAAVFLLLFLRHR
ncbi:ABC1 kinase family protein [Natronomonas sp.]|uniref:ABC1 kinase family protein n=1 Tax=Natronomonas sp. TaxID=2184060 RepID=UPI002FC35C09